MFDIINNHLAKLAAGDWVAYKADLAPDASYEEVSTRERVSGADAFVKAIQRWTRAFPDLKATINASYESGDKIITELTWQGTQRGPLEGPFGTIPPSNKFGQVNAIMVTTIKNKKIVETKHYFDVLTVLMQTGAFPALGAKVQPVAVPSPAPRTH